jgi:hypothetical protein
MNNSINISYLKSLILANIRSTYLTDSLRLYLIVPIGNIGTFLNIITILILINKKFNNLNIFKLMKIYSLTSCIISFTMIFSGLLFTPHILFDLSISKFARIYTCNIVSWILNLFFSYGNCLDILMNLERALSFSNKYHKIKQISAYLICFIVLIICVIIHIPSDLAGTYTPDDQLYITLKLCYPTSFASSPVTRMILIISYIIEGPVLIILAIVSNILAYVSYKSFMKRKEQLTRNTNNAGLNNELTKNEKRKIEKNEQMNKKMLIMTICLTIFSIISHLIQFGTQLIAFVLSMYFSSSYLAWARFIFSFIIIFKHFFTIFFYYYFNLNFKLMISSLICKKNTNNSVVIIIYH